MIRSNTCVRTGVTISAKNKILRTTAMFITVAIMALADFALPISRAQNHESTKPNPAIPEAKVKSRANDLLKQMTLDEKIAQLAQLPGFPVPEFAANSDGQTVEQIIEKRGAGSMLWVSDPKEIDRFQHIAVEKSRLHIPVLFGLDVIHGYRTIFPSPIAAASSWDPAMIEQAQTIAAKEARAIGINWTFAPMVDIARDARWGRMIEGAGEDPYLGSAVARAQVLGFQGREWGSPDHVLATAKHFAGYGAADGGRDYDSSYVPEELLRNVYLLPFHAAVKQGVGSLMSAYMDLNDVPASGNRWLLHDILRETWGFQGFVVSDANATGNLVTHGFAADREDAAYRAIIAGLNMDMASNTFIENVPKLVAAGKITTAQLDDAVRPILETKIKLGLFEHPFVDETKVDAVLDRQSSRVLERKLAARSMVLLRNQNHTLPLAKSIKKIALIGPLANAPRELEGSWTVEGLFGEPPKNHVVTVEEGLRNKLGADAQITVVSGPELRRDVPAMLDAILGKKPKPVPTPAELQESLHKAVEAAKQADLVVAVLGEAADMSGEAASRATLDLPGNQEQMLEAVAATGKPIVLVLVNGRPLDIRWAAEHVPAILEAWYPGTVGGDAVADVLFGDVNPGGKLPVTWPRTAGQEPMYYNHNLTHEPEDGKDFKSRYWDLSTKPLYPFGYGLSYTTFRFGQLHLSKTRIKSGEATEVSVEVTNTGQSAGDVVAQIYIHQRAGSASRPVRQLKGFRRIALAAGQSQTLMFPLGPDELSFWSPQAKAWGVEPATFDVWAGEDSTAPLHAEFEVTAQ
jgi:beta-glucosidase